MICYELAPPALRSETMPKPMPRPTPPNPGIGTVHQAFAAGEILAAKSKAWATGSAAKIPDFLKEPGPPRRRRSQLPSEADILALAVVATAPQPMPRGGDATGGPSIWTGRTPMEESG